MKKRKLDSTDLKSEPFSNRKNYNINKVQSNDSRGCKVKDLDYEF
jgi:hypothetical protein